MIEWIKIGFSFAVGSVLGLLALYFFWATLFWIITRAVDRYDEFQFRRRCREWDKTKA